MRSPLDGFDAEWRGGVGQVERADVVMAPPELAAEPFQYLSIHYGSVSQFSAHFLPWRRSRACMPVCPDINASSSGARLLHSHRGPGPLPACV